MSNTIAHHLLTDAKPDPKQCSPMCPLCTTGTLSSVTVYNSFDRGEATQSADPLVLTNQLASALCIPVFE